MKSLTASDGMRLFSQPAIRLVIVGGKGGVGKTTTAAAIAIHLAHSGAPDKRILLLSTDPAHSLADSLMQPVQDQNTPVVIDASTRIMAREIDAAGLMAQFKSTHHRELTALADRGTYFDQNDIRDFLNLSLPGMDEVMAVMELSDLISQNMHDAIVMDTAPTGHTLRMLELPDQMLQWIDVLELMQKKHRYLSATFSGKTYRKDFCDHFLDAMRQRIKRVKALLTDAAHTRFVAVTIAEALSVLETRRLVAALRKKRLPLQDIVINRVAPPHADCCICRNRSRLQAPFLNQIESDFPDCRHTRVPLCVQPIQGTGPLTGLGRFLAGKADRLSTAPDCEPRHTAPPDIWLPSGQLPAFSDNGSFLLVGGKGGVGKTTMAAAMAWQLAQQQPKQRHLIFSTDPAHSLADAFEIEIHQEPTRISDNLWAVQMDARKLFEDFKTTFKQDIESLFAQFMGGKAEIQFDREVMADLMTLAPPGLDEMMAIDHIIDLKSAFELDRLILDTAPTGHLLRFLAMPQLIREWLRVFFALLLKYRGVVKLTAAAEKALSLSKNIRVIQQTFQDPHQTLFVAVTLAEPMAVDELNDLTAALADLKMACGAIVINMITPPSKCDFCRCQRSAQLRMINKLHADYPTTDMFMIPLLTNDSNTQHRLYNHPDLDSKRKRKMTSTNKGRKP